MPQPVSKGRILIYWFVLAALGLGALWLLWPSAPLWAWLGAGLGLLVPAAAVEMVAHHQSVRRFVEASRPGPGRDDLGPFT